MTRRSRLQAARIDAVVEAVAKLCSEGGPPGSTAICHALLERPGVFREPFGHVTTGNVVLTSLAMAVADGRLQKLADVGSTYNVRWTVSPTP